MHLFTDFTAIHGAEFTSENQEMSEDVITKAFLATDEEFLSLVKKQWLSRPQIASVGTCCLVGIICSGLLYIANAGDSRVVLGRLERAFREVKAVQLSSEHNANFESVREELRRLHPNDPQIVVLKHKVWRVKGIIQVNSLVFIYLFTYFMFCKFEFWFSFYHSFIYISHHALTCIFLHVYTFISIFCQIFLDLCKNTLYFEILFKGLQRCLIE